MFIFVYAFSTFICIFRCLIILQFNCLIQFNGFIYNVFESIELIHLQCKWFNLTDSFTIQVLIQFNWFIYNVTVLFSLADLFTT